MSLVTALGWFAFLVAVSLGYQRITSCLTTLNIHTFFLMFFVLRYGLTIPIDHDVNARVTGFALSEATMPRYYGALILTYAFTLLGTWLAKVALRTPVVDETFGTSLAASKLPMGVYPHLFWIATVMVLSVVAITWIRVPQQGLAWLTSGLTAAGYRAWRDAYGELTVYSAGALNYAGSLARFALLPTLVTVLYCLRNLGWAYRLAFGLSLLLATGLGLLSGQKSPAIYVLLAVGVTAWLAAGRVAIRPWDWRVLLTALTLFFVVMPTLYVVQYPETSYVIRLGYTAFRLTSEASRSTQLYFHFYPDVFPFLHGASSFVLNKLLMLGYHDLSPERLIAVTVVGPQYLNTWNSAFFGYAWVDFGWAGVVVEAIMVGVLLQAIHHWFVMSQKSAALVGVYGSLIMAATKLSEVALPTSLLSFGIGSSVLFFLLIKRPMGKTVANGVGDRRAVTVAPPPRSA